jgi:hypothetical protein
MLHRLDLSGIWSFALDPDNVGLSSKWAATTLGDSIALPGSVDEAKKAPASSATTMAHLSRRHPYVGKAWYQRRINIAADQSQLYHWLYLERPHGQVDLFVNGIKIGRDESLSTPNRFFLGRLAEGEHTVTLLIDNERFEAVGDAHIAGGMPDVAHSKTEHTQTNWNGVVGSIELHSAGGGILNLAVKAPSRRVRISMDLEAYDTNAFWPTFWKTGATDMVRLSFSIAGQDRPVIEEHAVSISSALTSLQFDVELPETAQNWDEFAPTVHSLVVEWFRDGQLLDRTETPFGIRTIRSQGRHILLNDRRVFLRGTLDCCIFPLTGYPPTDKQGWRKAFETAAAYGLNHIRFHSYCPPKAAFEVADELGLLLHVETPIWAILGADPALDRYILTEAERIVAEYGNHPSFVMLTVGNEVYGARMHAFLERFVEYWQAKDARRIYSGGSGWPTIERANYVSKPEPRSHRWGEGLNSRLNARPLETRTDWSEWVQKVPMALVSHEIGQWCVYPDLREIDKYTGVLEARNFIAVRDDLAAKSMLPLADDFTFNSGRLQTMLYKEDIEAALRTPDFAGFQLLGLQDFPGQGTALVGVVDAFWDEKSYVSPQAFREFCAPTVPLLRADGFVVAQGGAFTADLQIAHYGATSLHAGQVTVTLVDSNGGERRKSLVDVAELKTGQLHDLGSISIDTTDLPDGLYQCVLSGNGFANRYEVAVFADAAPRALDIVSALDATTLGRIEEGATVVFSPSPETIKPNAELGHTTVFWNTLWTKGQAPHTLGLINDIDHPIFSLFPANSHSGWHQWALTHGRRALDMKTLDARALIRVIDDWNQNRNLVLLAEVKIGRGRLILSACDLKPDNKHLVARALRNAVAGYLEDGSFADAPSASVDELTSWWEDIRA